MKHILFGIAIGAVATLALQSFTKPSSNKAFADAIDLALGVHVPCPTDHGRRIAGSCNVSLGDYSGYYSFGVSRSVLIGSHVEAPPRSDGFVNIGNLVCFYRDGTGYVKCPSKGNEL